MNRNLSSARSPRHWLKITITASDRDMETTGDLLAHFTGNGVEHIAPDEGNRADKAAIIGYLEINQDIDNKKERLETFFNSLPVSENISIKYSSITEEDWGENWKKYFQPLQVTAHIVVKPSWYTYPPSARKIILEIDPGMAFGTGHHPSTCLALELIDSYFDETRKKQTVLDVGSGTGILAIACCLLGQSNVLAIDNDPDAIAIARKNARANQVTHTMTVTDIPLPDIEGTYDLIIANITHNVLIDVAPQLNRLLGKGGELILSGILKRDQAGDILQEYVNYGLKPLQMPDKEEWQAFRFIKE